MDFMYGAKDNETMPKIMRPCAKDSETDMAELLRLMYNSNSCHGPLTDHVSYSAELSMIQVNLATLPAAMCATS